MSSVSIESVYLAAVIRKLDSAKVVTELVGGCRKADRVEGAAAEVVVNL